jgi:hypothetical protein
MTTESFEKLQQLKSILGAMSIADKIDYTNTVSSFLPSSVLKTSDGHHTHSLLRNILSVTLGALVTDTRQEFEAVCGFYRNKYRSDLREGLYHGRGDVPHSQWRKEIRALYHNIKNNINKIPRPVNAM